MGDETQQEYETYLKSVEFANLWRNEHPAHCTSCGGWGIHVHISPGGDMIEEPCVCVIQCQCPHCADVGVRATDNAVLTECLTCGWQYGDPGIPTL